MSAPWPAATYPDLSQAASSRPTPVRSVIDASPSGSAQQCVHILAASGSNATQVKATAGVVYGVDFAVTGSGCQVRLYNTGTAAGITGTAANLVASYLVPPSGSCVRQFDPPLGGFTNGIAVCLAAYGVNDSSSLGVLASSTLGCVYFA